MRLLVVTQYFWPEDFRINGLIEDLITRGHDVTVLTGKPNYPDGVVFEAFRDRPTDYAVFHGARVIRVPMLARGRGAPRLLLNYLSFAISATIVGLWSLRKRDFDAVFVFEPSPITVGIPAVALRAARGWPVVFWVLDQWPETLAAVGVVRGQFMLDVIGRLATFIYTRCDVILAQSRALITPISKYCKPNQRVLYFPNWAETGNADAGTEPAPEVSRSDGEFTVLFTGNIGESQDFGAVLDAAERLREERVRWVIVGDGRAAAWVKSEVVRRGLQHCFTLVGRFPPSRMASFYGHASALLASLKPDPIFAMTVPAKVQSYLAAGLPIVGMLDGEGARIIDEANAGLTCASGDSHGLASIVLRLARMPESERRELGANGAIYARREFARDALTTRLEAILEDARATASTGSA